MCTTIDNITERDNYMMVRCGRCCHVTKVFVTWPADPETEGRAPDFDTLWCDDCEVILQFAAEMGYRDEPEEPARPPAMRLRPCVECGALPP